MSLLHTRTFTTTTHWVLAWCAQYTRDLPEEVAAARRDELASDLHEHALWADEAGWSAGRLRRDIVRRLVTGSIHDVSWRAHQLGRSAMRDPRHARTVRTAQRITSWMLALGVTLTVLGGYTYARIIRAIIIDDLRVPPLMAMLVGVLAVLSLVGTALTARRRTRIVGAVALAPPALLLGYVAVESLSLISATGVQIASWADHLMATAGSLGYLAAGVGISSLLGLVAAAIWWWPPTRTSTATEVRAES
ncbi:hypothetical protein PUY80_00330 [Plantibacter flavus]|uniref:hypothetical protein n=1 Tax=Plantibacter flavus TaxID=150123 RepID=UPI002377E1F1|nr:hypothetical protein [Plantibacter flavus]MDD9151006.1 hypothetical protein [Plantibacter flavus]